MKRGLVILAIALLVFFGKGVAVDFVTRGRRLTNAPVGPQGYVVETPADLARAASSALGRTVDVNAYALARMIRSESGSGTVKAKTAVGYVAVTDAQSHQWSLLYTLTVNNKRPASRFGPQAGGRYATSKDPYENDLKLAEAILAGAVDNPAPGATKFVHVGAFGVQAGTGTYERIVEKWGAEGYRPLELADVGDLVVFRRTV